MKKMLRKSTENRMTSTYITVMSCACRCVCMNHCGVEVSSWYPKEAHTSVDNTASSSTGSSSAAVASA